MHRDLKPSNILLSKNKHVRISDFGLEMSQSKGVGTMRFMAPEIFEEKEDDDEEEDDDKSETRYTNKVDVYSFGSHSFTS
ncbi:hypothetical protein M9Y10_018588 [Tritrichomonas musculus]|uniref:Protein kinase domain-containing protein n=1 Tax=Tritrichomonas musculus TaxID=1915356 RepID=A0ABR2HMT3_9EUKA